jgi:CubicO group peptidase (beta-lactamase class C family)
MIFRKNIFFALNLVIGLAFTSSDTYAQHCSQKIEKDFRESTSAPGSLEEHLLVLNQTLDSAKYDIRALLVLKNCELIFERYKDGFGREHNHAVYSVTKSISSTLVGNLLMQGKIQTIDAPINSLMSKPFGFSSEKWSKTERVTLKNVMQMSSGLSYQHDPMGHPIYDIREDRLSVALTPEFIAGPGSKFYYSDGDATLTGVTIAASANQNLYAFAKGALFEPLGFRNHEWSFMDRVGRYPGGWGLRLRPMDMLKLGKLYLQSGTWNGRKIFDESFVETAFRPGVSRHYGLHWWIGDKEFSKGISYFYANGVKGQRIYVFPDHDVVVALVSSLPWPEERIVATGVVSTVLKSLGTTSQVSPEKLKSDLLVAQSVGFSGETRTPQQDQDRPRR